MWLPSCSCSLFVLKLERRLLSGDDDNCDEMMMIFSSKYIPPSHPLSLYVCIVVVELIRTGGWLDGVRLVLNSSSSSHFLPFSFHFISCVLCSGWGSIANGWWWGLVKWKWSYNQEIALDMILPQNPRNSIIGYDDSLSLLLTLLFFPQIHQLNKPTHSLSNSEHVVFIFFFVCLMRVCNHYYC